MLNTQGEPRDGRVLERRTCECHALEFVSNMQPGLVEPFHGPRREGPVPEIELEGDTTTGLPRILHSAGSIQMGDDHARSRIVAGTSGFGSIPSRIAS